ncbi:GMP synthase (glutamine-hydrolysing) [Mycobacterium sp. BK558]|nr:GMP synthase (glutamine-hydrolysing) [Mycobacterium sp. BK558]
MEKTTVESHHSARLLVVQPDPKGLLDDFDEWLTARGVRITTIRPHVGDEVPVHLGDADAVLVLGGSMSSLDDAQYPWLERIRALLRDAHHARKPALGICLGGQLMAQAHGGSVSVGANGTEGGLITVRWRHEASGDALLSGLPDPLPVGALHGDAIDVLPPSARWLGQNSRYPHQAFRVGDTSWGLQFHPEVSADSMRMWVSCMDEEEVGVDDDLRRSAALFEHDYPQVRVHTAKLAGRFAGLITSCLERSEAVPARP